LYSTKVTEQQLAAALPAASTQWQKISGRSNFEFQRLTPSSAQQLAAALEPLLDYEGGKLKLKRELSNEEKRLVINERALCKWDAHYYWSRYYKIEHWAGPSMGMVLFEPNIAQNIIIDTWAEREEQGLHISQMILKARQEGITTLGQAAVAHRVHFHPNTNAVVGSSRPDKSTKLIDKALTAWQYVPWFLRPKWTRYKAGELIDFGAMHSSINIQHGAKVQSGMARGETPSMAHLTETAEYVNPERDVEGALVKAMHPHPQMFLLLESTAAGMGGWWYNTWQDAKKYWGNAYAPSSLQPIFLPYYVARDIYPTETWLRSNPTPADWSPATRSISHAKRAEAYVRNTPLLAKHLGSTWNMPREQLWFWEVLRAEHERTKKLNIFYQEMCSDDVECFQAGGSTVFDAELVMSYNSKIKDIPYAIYGVDGPTDEIRPELKPDFRDVDPNRKPLTIEAVRDNSKTTYKLVPLKMDGYPIQFNPTGKIIIWEAPADGPDYGLGIDTVPVGVGQDRGVIELLRKATLTKVPCQVAEFASEWVGAADMFPYAHCLAKLFSRKDDAGNQRQPYIVVETNNGGDGCQLPLRKAGWGRMHPWMRYDKKVIDASKASHLGVITTSWSRELVISYLATALKDGIIDINSPWFIQEMQSLEAGQTETGRTRIAAVLGRHDDRFMALGWIYLALHVTEFGETRSAFGKGRILDDAELPKPAATKPPSPEELPVAADFVADRMIQHQHSATPNWWPGDGMDSSW
jgi:hypothetical protein